MDTDGLGKHFLAEVNDRRPIDINSILFYVFFNNNIARPSFSTFRLWFVLNIFMFHFQVHDNYKLSHSILNDSILWDVVD